MVRDWVYSKERLWENEEDMYSISPERTMECGSTNPSNLAPSDHSIRLCSRAGTASARRTVGFLGGALSACAWSLFRMPEAASHAAQAAALTCSNFVHTVSLYRYRTNIVPLAWTDTIFCKEPHTGQTGTLPLPSACRSRCVPEKVEGRAGYPSMRRLSPTADTGLRLIMHS